MDTFVMLSVGLATYAAGAALATQLLRRSGHRIARDKAGLGAGPLLVAATANLVVGAAVMVEHAWLGRRPLATLGLDLGPREALACAATCALTCVLASAHGAAKGRRASFGGRPGAVIAAAAVALAAGAWMEEIVFRAFALAWLRPYGLGWALLGSSTAFTLVHVPTSRASRWALLDWLGGGLALGGVYVVTGSVWVATAAHLSRNVTNVLWLEPAKGSARDRSAYYAAWAVATFAVAWGVR